MPNSKLLQIESLKFVAHVAHDPANQLVQLNLQVPKLESQQVWKIAPSKTPHHSIRAPFRPTWSQLKMLALDIWNHSRVCIEDQVAQPIWKAIKEEGSRRQEKKRVLSYSKMETANISDCRFAHLIKAERCGVQWYES